MADTCPHSSCIRYHREIAFLGKLRKKVWINQGDIILVGLRDYQDAKADVILKYNPDEARNLKSYGELPEHAKINENVAFGEEEEDDNIEFDDVSGDEDIDDIWELYSIRRSSPLYKAVYGDQQGKPLFTVLGVVGIPYGQCNIDLRVDSNKYICSNWTLTQFVVLNS